jgi:pimeloyl-ACP methyl ester carboxylesterase
LSAALSEVDEFYVDDVFPTYVQKWRLRQADDQKRVVMIHGGNHTGMCFTRCPDGRPGWAQHLVGHGWTVFVPDWHGVGRSPRSRDFVTAGVRPIISGLKALLQHVGPAGVIGHSIGGALSARMISEIPELVDFFIAVAPVPPVVPQTRAWVREWLESLVFPLPSLESYVRFDEATVRGVFANASRFPHNALNVYMRSLCELSPSVFAAVGSVEGGADIDVADMGPLAEIPSIVVAGEEDCLTPEFTTRIAAHYLQCDLISVGRDWGLPGFGHMIPIEIGSEQILDRALASLTAF